MLKSLRRYATTESEPPEPIEQEEATPVPHGYVDEPLFGDAATTSADADVSREVRAWAGNKPERWKRVHTALLRIYTPAWERVDARDILVAWAAACLALTRAKRQLTRLERLQRPLGRRELDAKRARQADMSFWGRLANRLVAQVPTALAEDAEAAKVLAALVNDKHGDRE